MPCQNFGVVKWLIICLCATQQTIPVTLMEVVSPTRLPHSLHAAAQLAAGLWHLISMACQLKANVPTCPPLYVAPLQILTGLSYCLLTQPKATGHLHLRGWAGSASVDSHSGMWASVSCVWRQRRGKSRADQRAAQSICQLIDEEQRRGEWEGRWRQREKRWLKDLWLFVRLQRQPSLLHILSQHDWEREGDGDKSEAPHV